MHKNEHIKLYIKEICTKAVDSLIITVIILQVITEKNNKKNFTEILKRIIYDMQKGLYKITQISYNPPIQ